MQSGVECRGRGECRRGERRGGDAETSGRAEPEKQRRETRAEQRRKGAEVQRRRGAKAQRCRGTKAQRLKPAVPCEEKERETLAGTLARSAPI